MNRAAATLLLMAGNAGAHPGHGAAEPHFHGLAWEHLVWIFAVVALLTFAAWRRK